MNHVPLWIAAAIVVPGLHLSGVFAAGPPENPAPAAGALSALLNVAAPVPNPWAEVWDPFKSDQRKADWPVFVVPKGLRDLLHGEAITSGVFVCVFQVEDGRPAWEWQISELWLKGAHDRQVARAVKKRLLERAEEAGFKSIKMSTKALPWPISTVPGAERTVLRRARDSVEEIVAFTPLVWSPPSVDDADMKMCWKLRSTVAAPAPTYAEIVRALPCMEVRHDGKIPIPDSILRLLRPRQVKKALIDGGRVHYGLQLLVVVDPKEEKGPASLQSQLIKQSLAEGFEKEESPLLKPGELDFYKPSGESSCQVNIQPAKEGLLVSLNVMLDDGKEGRESYKPATTTQATISAPMGTEERRPGNPEIRNPGTQY
jgi:hypothetical protein